MGDLNRLRRAVLLPVLLVALGSVSSVFGQTLKGTILGTITDSSGAVVPAAQVVIVESGTNTSRTGTTNDSGLYVFANLDPGNYRVEVEHPGFRKVTRADIDVPPNNTVRIDLQLVPGAVSEVVDVTAAAPILKTDRADTGAQLETTALQNMPLGINRNYQNLLSTVPGVSHGFRTHSEFYNSQDSLTGYTNGQGSASNNFQIEGIDNNLENSDLTGIIPPIEALQTVDISTTNYDPELGRAGGSVTNLTIRSGTNDFHGAAFAFNKVTQLQAADVFATAKPPTVYNLFGGTFGGPIRKNKTFFFGDYQGDRDHKGTTDLVTIPNMPFRSGDFSKSPTIIYDPQTGAANGTGRTAFLNQQIPSNRLSEISQRLLAFIPPPTRPGDTANFEKPSVRVKSLNQADVKIDHVLSDNDRFMARYSYQGALVTDPGLYGPAPGIYGGPHNTGYEGTGPARTQSFGLNYSRVWSPTLVMEVRAGVLRNHNSALPWDYGTKASEAVGIKGANLDQWSSGLSGFNVNGYDTPMIGTRGDIPWTRSNTNLSFSNNWTKTLHAHVVKFGYDLRRYRRDLQQTTAGPRGLFTFGQGPSSLNGGGAAGYANSFADFVLDQPTIIAQSRPVVFPAQRDWLHALYVQDKWQVKPRLTLDLGLRWDYWPSSKPANPGGFSTYNWTNNTIELAGLGNIPMNLGIENQYKSFAPRLGFAYRINSKTVFRGGYGISYQIRALSGAGNFPIKQESTYNPPNSFAAAGSLAAGVPVPAIAAFPANGIISPAPPAVTASILKKDAPHPYVESWNVSLQRALPGNFSMEAAFVGNHAVNQNLNWNYNAVTQFGCGSRCQPFNALYGRTSAVNIGIGVHQYYDALQVKFDRRFHNGFMMTTAYTYSKTIDFSSRQTFNLLLDKGRSNNDITHVFVQSYLYELPFGQGKRWAHDGVGRAVLGGWQVNGIFTSQTGLPLNLTYSATNLNAPGQNNQPNLVGTGKPAVFGNVGPGQQWFDVTRFSAPVGQTFGNVGRNILSGPGLVGLDLSLFRNVRIKEKMSLQIRAEALNFTNTPHFSNPGTTLGNANFGQVTGSNDFTDSTNDTDNRKIQFGIRLSF